MRRVSLWILFVALGVGLILGGMSCSGRSKKKDKLITEELVIPEHFALIPADTPYVFADIKPLPYEQMDWAFAESYGQFLDVLRGQADESIRMMQSYGEKPDTSALLARAVLTELDGNLSIEGLQKLGISPEAHAAFYGIGVFPVFRMQLADAAAFEAMLTRIEEQVGESLPKKTYESYTYRELSDSEVVVPIIVTDREVIVGVTSTKFAEEFLAYATGVKKPARSMKEDNRLLAMMKAYEFKPYLAGYVDIQGIVAGVMGLTPESTGLFAQSIISTGESLPQLSEVCRNEFMQLAKTTPRFVTGIPEITRDSSTGVMGVEQNGSFISTLQGTRGTIPGYGSAHQKDSLFSVGVGLKIKELVGAIRAETEKVQAAPFACPDLAELNEVALSTYFSIQSTPSWAQSIQGASVMLRDLELTIDPAGMKPPQLEKLRATATVRTTDPAGLYATIKLFVPQLAGVTLTPNGQPVPVPLPPEITAAVPNLPTPYLVMTGGGLGVALGEGMNDALTGTMTTEDKPTPVFTMGYDISRLYELISKVAPDDPEFTSMMEMYQRFGAAIFDLNFEERGVYTRVQATYKASPQPSTPTP